MFVYRRVLAFLLFQVTFLCCFFGGATPKKTRTSFLGGGNSNIWIIFTPNPGDFMMTNLTPIFFRDGLVQPCNQIWFHLLEAFNSSGWKIWGWFFPCRKKGGWIFLHVFNGDVGHKPLLKDPYKHPRNQSIIMGYDIYDRIGMSPNFFLLNVAHLGRPPENWVSFPSKYVKDFTILFWRSRWWFTWMMIISSSLGCRFRFFASEFFLGFIGVFKWVTPSHLQKGETRYDRWQLEYFLGMFLPKMVVSMNPMWRGAYFSDGWGGSTTKQFLFGGMMSLPCLFFRRDPLRQGGPPSLHPWILGPKMWRFLFWAVPIVGQGELSINWFLFVWESCFT